MAAQFFQKISPTKLAFTSPLRYINFVKHLKYEPASICFASRRLNSSGSSSKLDNLASAAEKVVGYQTNLLRCLLSDEVSNVLVHSKKLVGSRHPLLKTARNLVYDGTEGFDTVGLVILLLSRCGKGLMSGGAPLGEEEVSGIQQKQRKLAEVAEMINAGYMVHLGMVNNSDFQPSDDTKIMNFGNKITVLTGDFFLAKASVGLSELENAEVVDILAGVIGDIVEGETLKDYKTVQDTSLDDWEDIGFKSRGSLFAKSCLATIKLCSLSQKYEDAGFAFGKNLAHLQKISKDFQELKGELETISLNNAAIIENKHILSPDQLTKSLNTFISVEKTMKEQLQSFEIFKSLEDLANDYGNSALKSLEIFPNSEAKNCLDNLVRYLMALYNK
ncbi:decaprenyl-diphosphate synthase subunit 2-like [Dendronephthya gigantea]|uniref:decaprenyl-diphosphate synthase subunit 2-like n=1 Tax=Dendronephthya gigantea TaxID=151771 RepID=UPI00106BE1C8|nr:decaprenyl-diphosphate synthase subunit 2-like [Dendronephthya gigantea]